MQLLPTDRCEACTGPARLGARTAQGTAEASSSGGALTGLAPRIVVPHGARRARSLESLVIAGNCPCEAMQGAKLRLLPVYSDWRER